MTGRSERSRDAVASLAESERRYRRLFQMLLEGYAFCRMLYDADGRAVDFEYVEVNPMFERLTGLVGAQGKRVSELIPGITETNPEVLRAYDDVIRTGTPAEFETFLPQIERTLHVSAYAVGPESFVAVFEDVTEERRNEDLLRGVIEGTSDVIYVKDPEGRYLLFNEGAAALYGRAPEDVLGRDDEQVFGETQGLESRRRDRDILTAGTLRTHVEKVRGADGTDHYLLSKTGPMHDPTGRATGTFCIARDITDRKLMEDEIRALNLDLENRVRDRTAELTAANESLLAANTELAELNSRLDEATRAKSEFLASMSHELRTPLNSILGFSGLLLKGMAGPLNEEQRMQLSMVANAGRHLLTLVNHVLDLSRIEAGRMPLDVEEFDASEAAHAIVESLMPLAVERGLALALEDRTGGVRLVSDPTRFKQILLNLVGNALRFTESGSVTLSLQRSPAGVRAEVTDTGTGIPEGELMRVFDDFYQVPRSDGSKTRGTGLGLPVSRKMAQLLGGTVSAKSTEGRGSTFTLELPDMSGRAETAGSGS